MPPQTKRAAEAARGVARRNEKAPARRGPGRSLMEHLRRVRGGETPRQRSLTCKRRASRRNARRASARQRKPDQVNMTGTLLSASSLGASHPPIQAECSAGANKSVSMTSDSSTRIQRQSHAEGFLTRCTFRPLQGFGDASGTCLLPSQRPQRFDICGCPRTSLYILFGHQITPDF
jgi:hypothetical protein